MAVRSYGVATQVAVFTSCVVGLAAGCGLPEYNPPVLPESSSCIVPREKLPPSHDGTISSVTGTVQAVDQRENPSDARFPEEGVECGYGYQLRFIATDDENETYAVLVHNGDHRNPVVRVGDELEVSRWSIQNVSLGSSIVRSDGITLIEWARSPMTIEARPLTTFADFTVAPGAALGIEDTECGQVKHFGLRFSSAFGAQSVAPGDTAELQGAQGVVSFRSLGAAKLQGGSSCKDVGDGVYKYVAVGITD